MVTRQTSNDGDDDDRVEEDDSTISYPIYSLIENLFCHWMSASCYEFLGIGFGRGLDGSLSDDDLGGNVISPDLHCCGLFISNVSMCIFGYPLKNSPTYLAQFTFTSKILNLYMKEVDPNYQESN